nr:MAG TPA: hypothetical protein [Caudoviricetes sp.]
MKFFRKNLNSNFIRICRIQITSEQRNQNLYPDHLYDFTIKLDNIYKLDRIQDVKDYKLKLFTSDNLFFFVNSTELYYKLTETETEKYIDIGMYIPTYSTNIHIDVDTVNDGTITFYCDKANINEYIRINYVNTSNSNIIYYNSNRFVFTNTSVKLCLAKTYNRITELTTNTPCFIEGKNISNADNAKFKLTIEQETDYSIIVNIVAKSNCNLFIENFEP